MAPKTTPAASKPKVVEPEFVEVPDNNDDSVSSQANAESKAMLAKAYTDFIGGDEKAALASLSDFEETDENELEESISDLYKFEEKGQTFNGVLCALGSLPRKGKKPIPQGYFATKGEDGKLKPVVMNLPAILEDKLSRIPLKSAVRITLTGYRKQGDGEMMEFSVRYSAPKE